MKLINKNLFDQVLDCLSYNESSKDVLLRFEMAKNSPQAFVNAFHQVYNNSGLSKNVIYWIDRDEHINAIKEQRTLTGQGLKEAKHAIDEYKRKRGLV